MRLEEISGGIAEPWASAPFVGMKADDVPAEFPDDIEIQVPCRVGMVHKGTLYWIDADCQLVNLEHAYLCQKPESAKGLFAYLSLYRLGRPYRFITTGTTPPPEVEPLIRKRKPKGETRAAAVPASTTGRSLAPYVGQLGKHVRSGLPSDAVIPLPARIGTVSGGRVYWVNHEGELTEYVEDARLWQTEDLVRTFFAYISQYHGASRRFVTMDTEPPPEVMPFVTKPPRKKPAA